MKKKPLLVLLVFTILIVFAAGCQGEGDPTATATLALPSATPIPPTYTPTPVPPTALPTATDTPMPTATTAPTETPVPVVAVLVIDAATAATISGATVRITQADHEYESTQTTADDGRVVFSDIPAGQVPYIVETEAIGYQPRSQEILVISEFNEVPVRLERGVLATIIPPVANMRSGPSLDATIVAEIPQGTVLPVLDITEDADWVQALSAEGIEGWLFANLVSIEGDTNLLAGAEDSPSTPPPTVQSDGTPSPDDPKPIAGSVAPPIGENLLQNPSFEQNGDFWSSDPLGSAVKIHTEVQFPAFVLFPDKAAYAKDSGTFYQQVSGLVPGSVYRLAAWSRTWSSIDSNRNQSTNPGTYITFVCINPNGGPDISTAVCTGFEQPIGRWVNMAVDVVATNSTATVFLVANLVNGPENNEAMWDNAAFGISPISGTPTPTPTATPIIIQTSTPSAASGGAEFQLAVENLMNVLTEMGGVLDRFAHGDPASCAQYQAWHYQVVTAPKYYNIPQSGEGAREWNLAYDAYIAAIDDTLGTNEPLMSYCDSTDPDKNLDPGNVALARSAIDVNYPIFDQVRSMIIQLIELGYG